MSSTPTRAPAASAQRRHDRAREVTALAIGGLLVAFALLNLGEVSVNWILGSWRTPLIVVVVVSMALGIAIGALASSRRRRAR